jgi:hypothetical protein
VTDLSAIEKLVDEIIAKNPDKVEQVKAKPNVLGWFVGQVMKARGSQPASGQRLSRGDRNLTAQASDAGAGVANMVRLRSSRSFARAKISPAVTPRHVRAPPRTPRRANRLRLDLRVLRLARAVNRPAEGVRRKIFLAW